MKQIEQQIDEMIATRDIDYIASYIYMNHGDTAIELMNVLKLLTEEDVRQKYIVFDEKDN